MTEALKPCPFCGGDAEIRSWDWPYDRFQVRCGACKAGPASRLAVQMDAIAAWNRRSALDGDALAKLIREAEARGMERAMALPAYDSDGDPSGPFDHKVFVKIDAIRAAAAALRKDEEPK